MLSSRRISSAYPFFHFAPFRATDRLHASEFTPCACVSSGLPTGTCSESVTKMAVCASLSDSCGVAKLSFLILHITLVSSYSQMTGHASERKRKTEREKKRSSFRIHRQAPLIYNFYSQVRLILLESRVSRFGPIYLVLVPCLPSQTKKIYKLIMEE